MLRPCALTSHFYYRCYRPSIAYILVCIMLTTGTLYAQNRENLPGTLKEIRFGALSDIYSDISKNDGRMTVELLMQKAIVKKSYPYSVKLVFIDPEPALPEAIQQGRYHFVTLSSVDYYKNRKAVHLEPILIPSKTGKPVENLLLLVGRDQTLSTILEKEERSLIVEGGAIGDLSKIWLDMLLLDRGLPDSTQFFTKIRHVKKPGRAVLPVFFNQADACVVTKDALESIEELNPQIGSQLKSLYQSEGLVRFMICATREPTRKDIDTLINETINMDRNPDTRQAMTIIQMKSFLKITPEDLAATEELFLRHAKITKPIISSK
jgi:ABC-type phosphate/phosphonate transport system substrate-binding protein